MGGVRHMPVSVHEPLEVKFIARELKVNDQIRVRQVRLITETGEQIGIVDTRDAIRRARENDLDLVLVGEAAQPPVTGEMISTLSPDCSSC